MVRQTASTIFFEILGGLLLIAVLLVAFAAWRLSEGPVALDFIHDDIESAITEARDGREVKLKQVFLEWSPEERRVQVTADGIEMFDDEGLATAKAARAVIDMDAGSVVMRNPEILGINLQGGWVAVDQVSSSEWKLAGDPLPALPMSKAPESPEEWLAMLNTRLPQMLGVLKAGAAELAAEEVAFTDMEIIIRGTDRGEIARIENAAARLARKEGGATLSVSGAGLGDGLPAGLAADLVADNDFQTLTAEFGANGWPLAALASRLGAEEEGVSGLPADIRVAFDVTGEAGIQSITITADAGAGRLPFAGGIDLEDLKFEGTYGAADDTLVFTAETSEAGVFAGDIAGTVETFLKGNGQHAISLKSNAVRLDLTPRFAEAFDLSAVTLDGAIDLERGALKADTLRFDSRGATFNMSGDIAATENRNAEIKEPPVTGNLQAEVSGEVTKETVLHFWPVALGEGAREFLKERMEAGTVTDVKATLDLKRDSFSQGFLQDDALLVTFNATGAKVRFLEDLPPVEEATGRGRLTGNTFRVDLDTANYGEWVLSEGLVDFPALNPKGNDFRVFAKGTGPANDVVKTLVNSRLQLDFDPARISGGAEGTFELFRPALKDVPPEATRFTANATVRQAGLKDVAQGYSLENGQARIDVNQDGLTITGFGDLGPAPVQFTWRDGFRNGDAPSDLSASAVVTPDLLNSFGLLGRSYLTGDIPLEMQAKLKGEGLQSADVSMDLDDARVDVSEVGWVKPAGEPGKASIQYRRAGDTQHSATVLFSSETAKIDGDVVLGDDGKLASATLRRAFLKDTADVSGTVRRGAKSSVELSLRGPFIDLSGAVPELGAMGSGSDARTPLTLDAEVERLRLRQGLDMTGARLALISTPRGVQRFRASGKASDGSQLEASYDATGEGPPKVRVVSGNAGFLTGAFLGADFLEGGQLIIDGQMGAGSLPTKLDISIKDARLYDAPFLTQILSLASLRGLADTLGGEGVLFSSIDVPITIAGGRYVVEGARASGPALGLTAKGYLEAETGAIEVDGVLVPSFGLNSALGQVPIIGDLVVGRDGEGVFSLTYGVNGTLEQANVSVNPLSALAPGVIRRIFENPSDTTIPEAVPRDPSDPIPSELEPIVDEEEF